ncbi:MAG TPA: 3-hydroxyacyl-CoA dehydrogenase family protein [Candidatus Fraserbacteria bacterium]|nr:3-hydroxyacyl-CoA dehydrogenase family protein [Candidatus Fraserbacteria bacterium]
MPNQVPNTSAVIGSGTMGPGIALMMARSGSAVYLMDIDEKALQRAREGVQMASNVLKSSGELTEASAHQALGRIHFTTSLSEAVKSADFISEAVPEKLELKQKVFSEMEALVSSDTILSSNTSGIPISKLQEGRSRPERIVGMHWSNPPHIIPVIEIIRGDHTADQTVETTRNYALAMNQVPVVEHEIPGFVENRILYAIMREALHLAETGVASMEDIDATIRWGIGMKLAVIGPLALLDVAGLDIYHSVASYLNQELCSDTGISRLVEEKVTQKNLGFKTGKGLFDYAPGEIPELMRARVATLLKLRQELMKADV